MERYPDPFRVQGSDHPPTTSIASKGEQDPQLGSDDDVPKKCHVVMIGTAWCLLPHTPEAPCNALVCNLVQSFLVPKSFSIRLSLIHPLTPVDSIGLKEKKKLVITLKSARRLIEISDLMHTIKKTFLSILKERLVCATCMSSLGIRDPLCGVCGSKKLLAMPSAYSEFAPVNMINQIKQNKLKPACAEEASVIKSRLTVNKIELPEHERATLDESAKEDEIKLEGSMLDLSLGEREGLPVRNKEVERDFINSINNVPMKTLASLRVKGFRTRPLSFSASDLKSGSRVQELIHSNVLSRVRKADIKQLSPLYDLLIGEMGNDDNFPRWDSAGSKGAQIDLGEFGTVGIRGSPDAMFDGIPVELKTCKASLTHGASASKVISYILQMAVYMKTHSIVTDGGGPGVIFILVSLKDHQVVSFDIPPMIFDKARQIWLRSLRCTFSSQRYRRYWDRLFNFRNLDDASREKVRVKELQILKGWLQQDSVRELNEACELIPKLWEKGVASEFERKVNLARKLCLMGRNSAIARREDAVARKILNRIVKETNHVFKLGNKIAIASWAELKGKASALLATGSREEILAVKLDVRKVIEILELMMAIARWRGSNEDRVISSALTDISDTMREWKRIGKKRFPAFNGLIDDDVFAAVGAPDEEDIEGEFEEEEEKEEEEKEEAEKEEEEKEEEDDEKEKEEEEEDNKDWKRETLFLTRMIEEKEIAWKAQKIRSEELEARTKELKAKVHLLRAEVKESKTATKNLRRHILELTERKSSLESKGTFEEDEAVGLAEEANFSKLKGMATVTLPLGHPRRKFRYNNNGYYTPPENWDVLVDAEITICYFEKDDVHFECSVAEDGFSFQCHQSFWKYLKSKSPKEFSAMNQAYLKEKQMQKALKSEVGRPQKKLKEKKKQKALKSEVAKDAGVFSEAELFSDADVVSEDSDGQMYDFSSI